MAGTYAIEGRSSDPSQLPHAQSLAATRGYFAAMGMRIVRGRLFADADSPASEPVAIVNDVFVARFLPGEEPIDRRIHVYAKVWARIVGVVAGARIGPMTTDPPPAVFQYAPQLPDILGYGERGSGMAVRVTGNPEAVMPFIRDQVRELAPGWAVYDAQPLESELGQTFSQPRFYSIVLGLFAVLATSTALLGLYGVLAYSVERRRHEVGIRRALGADVSHIVALVITRAFVLAGVGLALGIGTMAVAARMLRAMLFGVAPLDVVSFGGGVLAIVGVVVIASWVPVRRALTIDPAHVLRVE
jgi:putative ABC transport system permease protein